ncbi:MAG TPA: hypothetical protein VG164_12980 [Trebonia sp.]|jgi:hypothetical protein|nr:hypothetical protein [Trebonia sp.]
MSAGNGSVGTPSAASAVSPAGAVGAAATVNTAATVSTAGPDQLRSTAVADRMRELLARTAADQVVDHRFTEALEAIRRRVDAIEQHVRELSQARASAPGQAADPVASPGQSLAGIAASLDGLAGSLGTFDSRISGMVDSRLGGTESKLSALDNRLERLDERLDDQYDRVTSIDGKLSAATTQLDALVTDLRARPDRTEVAELIDEARTDVAARVTSLEETVLTLAEALLRPPVPHHQNGKTSISSLNAPSDSPA